MKLLYAKYLASFILILCSFNLIAQNATVKGIVIDENSDPVIGATIIVKKGADVGLGTITDYDGSYELSLQPGTSTIEITYIGYSTLTQVVNVEAGGTQTLDLKMETEATLLETTVVVATKNPQNIGQSTAPIEVIKPALIENTNSTSVDEVLEKVPGVQIIDGQANIRGGSGYSYGAGSRVLLLIDDIPALQADAGFPNWDDVPVENVAQIEVLKGAASALYGSSALNGIVNVRTAYATSEPYTKAGVFYQHYMAPKDTDKQWWKGKTSPYTTGLSFAHRQKFGKLDLVLGTYAYRQESFRQALEEEGDGPDDVRGSTNMYGRVNLGLRYRINENLSVGFNSNFNPGTSNSFFFWRDSGANAYVGATNAYTDTPSRLRFIIDPYLTYFDKTGNRHKVLTRYFNSNNNNGDNRSNQSQLYYGEYQFQRNFEESDFTITAGLVGISTAIQAELYSNSEFSSNNFSAYAQVDKKFFDKLFVSGGARYERNSITNPYIEVTNTDGTVVFDTIQAASPSEAKPVFRLGLNYQPAQYTFIRASWGQGYRFPTVAEKFIDANVGFRIFPNEDLGSETGWTTDFGIKQGVKISNWEAFIDFSLFWSEYQDMMEFNPFVYPVGGLGGVGFRSRNIGTTIIKGTDLSIAGRGKLFGVETSLLAGYTYIDPTFEFFDTLQPPPGSGIEQTVGQINAAGSSAKFNVLKYRFQHSFKFDIESTFKAFSVGFTGFYNSPMENVDVIFFSVIPEIEDYLIANNKGFAAFDLRMAYRIKEDTKISLICKNIFNKEYALRPALLDAPRNITLRLDHQFQ